MGVAEMIVAIVAIVTTGKVLRGFALGRANRETAGQIQALRRTLDATEARLQQAEERVADLSEKLAFVENVLAGPQRSPTLPPRTGG